MVQVAGSQCVRAGKVPNHASTVGPWQHCQSVWPFAVISRQRVRLEYRRDVGGRQRALYQIIYSVVAHVTSRRFATRQAVDSGTVDLLATDTGVWSAHRGAKTQCDGNAQRRVVEPRSNCGARDSVQKVARMRCCSRNKPGTPNWRLCSRQHLITFLIHQRHVPRLLDSRPRRFWNCSTATNLPFHERCDVDWILDSRRGVKSTRQ